MHFSHVTLKQVRAFVAIARSRSFAEAAALLHLSQPALSSAIKNLEQAVGGQLLTRTTRAFALTPEGESFLPTAQRLLTEWDGALEDVHNRFTLRTGRITIAAMPSFAANLLPKGLSVYKGAHPKVRVALHDVIAEDVVRMVRSGQAEIGISFFPGEHEDLLFTPLFEDHFVAVMPQEHPLSGNPQISLTDLAGEELITLQAPSQVRGLIADFFQQHELPFTPALEAHQLVTVGKMVASGLGISLVPALSEQQMREVGACCRPLKDVTLSRQVGILTRKRYPLSAASKAMLDIFITTFVESSVNR